MKKLVGKRSGTPDLELRSVGALLSMFMTGSIPPTTRSFTCSCQKCNCEVQISLSEDPATHEIWAEGPDNCPQCGHGLVEETPSDVTLSQEAIHQLFGQVLPSVGIVEGWDPKDEHCLF